MAGSLWSLGVDLEEALVAAEAVRHRQRLVVAQRVEPVWGEHPNDFEAAVPREYVPNLAEEGRQVGAVEQTSAHPNGADGFALQRRLLLAVAVALLMMMKRRFWAPLGD